MTATTKLRSILDIDPGTLIKGLYVAYSCSVHFNLEGWDLTQRKYIKGLWSAVDREQFVFGYYSDSRVSELLTRQKLVLYQSSNMNFKTFKQNGEAYYKDIKRWTKQEQIGIGDCLGMSLGENFIAIQPSHADLYRPDFYEVYLFHKVLHNNTIKWIILHSKTISKKKIILNPQVLLLDINMELL